MIKISKGESKSKCKRGGEREEEKGGEFVDVNVNAAELVKEESWKSSFLFSFQTMSFNHTLNFL